VREQIEGNSKASKIAESRFKGDPRAMAYSKIVKKSVEEKPAAKEAA